VSDVVVRAEGLGKKYWVGHQAKRERYTALRDVMSNAVRGFVRSARDMMRGRQLVMGDEIEEFWALRDVNFEIKRGQVVGIIGRNGAGKSTLLKILSRITEPTTGRVTIKGRVASLLEVGTGFHPELSGRENVFLNGAILGMSRAEIRRKFDEIVNFAEIERFLDTPVKRYSSCMYMRLAFAVAAHLEPEILIVDEVLAVGDAEFQKKCLGKMQDVAGHGRTVIFVSHNLSAIRGLCSNAFFLDRGELPFVGDVEGGLAAYENSFRRSLVQIESVRFVGPLSNIVSFKEIRLNQDGKATTVIDPMRELKIEIVGESLQSISGFVCDINLFRDGAHIATCYDTAEEAPVHRGSFTSTFTLPAGLFQSGVYLVSLGATISNGWWMLGSEVAALEFSESALKETNRRARGLVRLPYVARRTQQLNADDV